MKKQILTTMIVACGLATQAAMAQVETRNAHTILDATWTEAESSTAQTDQQLFLEGRSTIHFTVKNTAPTKVRYDQSKGKFVADENGKYDNTPTRYIAMVQVRAKNGTGKGTAYYRYRRLADGSATFEKATTRTKSGTQHYTKSSQFDYTRIVSETKSSSDAEYYKLVDSYEYNWSEPQTATDGTIIEGTIDVENGLDDDYLYMSIIKDDSNDDANLTKKNLYYRSSALSLWSNSKAEHVIYNSDTDAGYHHSVILSRLTSTTLRYDIYDDKPLWTQTGENTNSSEAQDIRSNRLNAKSHASKEISVYVHRSLTGGTWGTLCLPFDVAVADIRNANALGSDVIIAEFSNVDLANDVVNFNTISSSTATLKAGKPYLIRYNGADKDDFFAPNVTFNYTSATSQTALSALTNRKSAVVSHGYGFVGLLEPTYAGAETENLGDGCMVYVATPAAGTTTQHLKRLKEGGRIKAFRAYLYYPKGAKASAAKGNGIISIDEELNSSTGLVQVKVDGLTVNNRIYNLKGQLVGTDATALPAGIYVRGGRKFIVK